MPELPISPSSPVQNASALAGALAASILLLPVFLFTLAACAVSMAADGPGPLFRQTRVGFRGRRFEILKLRTMTKVPGPLMTLPRDPRITSLGRVLRSLSLDEVPQVFNVAMGSMDFVGPRPDLPTQVDGYAAPMKTARLSVRPGITGIAQAFGRSSLNRRQRDALDVYYVTNRGIFLDLVVLARTISAVAGRHGSY